MASMDSEMSQFGRTTEVIIIYEFDPHLRSIT